MATNKSGEEIFYVVNKYQPTPKKVAENSAQLGASQDRPVNSLLSLKSNKTSETQCESRGHNYTRKSYYKKLIESRVDESSSTVSSVEKLSTVASPKRVGESSNFSPATASATNQSQSSSSFSSHFPDFLSNPQQDALSCQQVKLKTSRKQKIVYKTEYHPHHPLFRFNKITGNKTPQPEEKKLRHPSNLMQNPTPSGSGQARRISALNSLLTDSHTNPVEKLWKKSRGFYWKDRNRGMSTNPARQSSRIVALEQLQSKAKRRHFPDKKGSTLSPDHPEERDIRVVPNSRSPLTMTFIRSKGGLNEPNKIECSAAEFSSEALGNQNRRGRKCKQSLVSASINSKGESQASIAPNISPSQETTTDVKKKRGRPKKNVNLVVGTPEKSNRKRLKPTSTETSAKRRKRKRSISSVLEPQEKDLLYSPPSKTPSVKKTYDLRNRRVNNLKVESDTSDEDSNFSGNKTDHGNVEKLSTSTSCSYHLLRACNAYDDLGFDNWSQIDVDSQSNSEIDSPYHFDNAPSPKADCYNELGEDETYRLTSVSSVTGNLQRKKPQPKPEFIAVSLEGRVDEVEENCLSSEVSSDEEEETQNLVMNSNEGTIQTLGDLKVNLKRKQDDDLSFEASNHEGHIITERDDNIEDESVSETDSVTIIGTFQRKSQNVIEYILSEGSSDVEFLACSVKRENSLTTKHVEANDIKDEYIEKTKGTTLDDSAELIENASLQTSHNEKSIHFENNNGEQETQNDDSLNIGIISNVISLKREKDHDFDDNDLKYSPAIHLEDNADFTARRKRRRCWGDRINLQTCDDDTKMISTLKNQNLSDEASAYKHELPKHGGEVYTDKGLIAKPEDIHAPWRKLFGSNCADHKTEETDLTASDKVDEVEAVSLSHDKSNGKVKSSNGYEEVYDPDSSLNKEKNIHEEAQDKNLLEAEERVVDEDEQKGDDEIESNQSSLSMYEDMEEESAAIAQLNENMHVLSSSSCSSECSESNLSSVSTHKNNEKESAAVAPTNENSQTTLLASTAECSKESGKSSLSMHKEEFTACSQAIENVQMPIVAPECSEMAVESSESCVEDYESWERNHTEYEENPGSEVVDSEQIKLLLQNIPQDLDPIKTNDAPTVTGVSSEASSSVTSDSELQFSDEPETPACVSSEIIGNNYYDKNSNGETPEDEILLAFKKSQVGSLASADIHSVNNFEALKTIVSSGEDDLTQINPNLEKSILSRTQIQPLNISRTELPMPCLLKDISSGEDTTKTDASSDSTYEVNPINLNGCRTKSPESIPLSASSNQQTQQVSEDSSTLSDNSEQPEVSPDSSSESGNAEQLSVGTSSSTNLLANNDENNPSQDSQPLDLNQGTDESRSPKEINTGSNGSPKESDLLGSDFYKHYFTNPQSGFHFLYDPNLTQDKALEPSPESPQTSTTSEESNTTNLVDLNNDRAIEVEKEKFFQRLYKLGKSGMFYDSWILSTCQKCQRWHSCPRDASRCLKSHRLRRCWKCGETWTVSDPSQASFSSHNKQRHKIKPTQVTTVCPYCIEELPFSVSLRTHIEVVHFDIPEDKLSTDLDEFDKDFSPAYLYPEGICIEYQHLSPNQHSQFYNVVISKGMNPLFNLFEDTFSRSCMSGQYLQERRLLISAADEFKILCLTKAFMVKMGLPFVDFLSNSPCRTRSVQDSPELSFQSQDTRLATYNSSVPKVKTYPRYANSRTNLGTDLENNSSEAEIISSQTRSLRSFKPPFNGDTSKIASSIAVITADEILQIATLSGIEAQKVILPSEYPVVASPNLRTAVNDAAETKSQTLRKLKNALLSRSEDGTAKPRSPKVDRLRSSDDTNSNSPSLNLYHNGNLCKPENPIRGEKSVALPQTTTHISMLHNIPVTSSAQSHPHQPKTNDLIGDFKKKRNPSQSSEGFLDLDLDGIGRLMKNLTDATKRSGPPSSLETASINVLPVKDSRIFPEQTITSSQVEQEPSTKMKEAVSDQQTEGEPHQVGQIPLTNSSPPTSVNLHLESMQKQHQSVALNLSQNGHSATQGKRMDGHVNTDQRKSTSNPVPFINQNYPRIRHPMPTHPEPNFYPRLLQIPMRPEPAIDPQNPSTMGVRQHPPSYPTNPAGFTIQTPRTSGIPQVFGTPQTYNQPPYPPNHGLSINRAGLQSNTCPMRQLGQPYGFHPPTSTTNYPPRPSVDQYGLRHYPYNSTIPGSIPPLNLENFSNKPEYNSNAGQYPTPFNNNIRSQFPPSHHACPHQVYHNNSRGHLPTAPRERKQRIYKPRKTSSISKTARQTDNFRRLSLDSRMMPPPNMIPFCMRHVGNMTMTTNEVTHSSPRSFPAINNRVYSPTTATEASPSHSNVSAEIVSNTSEQLRRNKSVEHFQDLGLSTQPISSAAATADPQLNRRTIKTASSVSRQITFGSQRCQSAENPSGSRNSISALPDSENKERYLLRPTPRFTGNAALTKDIQVPELRKESARKSPENQLTNDRHIGNEGSSPPDPQTLEINSTLPEISENQAPLNRDKTDEVSVSQHGANEAAEPSESANSESKNAQEQDKIESLNNLQQFDNPHSDLIIIPSNATNTEDVNRVETPLKQTESHLSSTIPSSVIVSCVPKKSLELDKSSGTFTQPTVNDNQNEESMLFISRNEDSMLLISRNDDSMLSRKENTLITERIDISKPSNEDSPKDLEIIYCTNPKHLEVPDSLKIGIPVSVIRRCQEQKDIAVHSKDYLSKIHTVSSPTPDDSCESQLRNQTAFNTIRTGNKPGSNPIINSEDFIRSCQAVTVGLLTNPGSLLTNLLCAKLVSAEKVKKTDELFGQRRLSFDLGCTAIGIAKLIVEISLRIFVYSMTNANHEECANWSDWGWKALQCEKYEVPLKVESSPNESTHESVLVVGEQQIKDCVDQYARLFRNESSQNFKENHFLEYLVKYVTLAAFGLEYRGKIQFELI